MNKNDKARIRSISEHEERDSADRLLSASEHDRKILREVPDAIAKAYLSPTVSSIDASKVPDLLIQLFNESTLHHCFSNEEANAIRESYVEKLQLACKYLKIVPIHVRTLVPADPFMNWIDLSDFFISRNDLDDFALHYCGLELISSQENLPATKEAPPAMVETLSFLFDPSATNYPVELDWAMKAWSAVKDGDSSGKSPKQQIISWLKANANFLSKEQHQRIATVANWNKKGGAPKTP